MTITVDDVKRIYAEEVLRGKSPEDARAGTRTVVQMQLSTDSPPPHCDRPSDLVGIEEKRAASGEKARITREESARIKAHQVAQLTDADLIASEKARSGPDGTHVDAHHFKQKMHQKKLWEQTEVLVASALGVAS